MILVEKFIVDNNVFKAFRAVYNILGLLFGWFKILDNDFNVCVLLWNVGEKLDCNGKNICCDKYLLTVFSDVLSGNDVDVANVVKYCVYVLYLNVCFIFVSVIFYFYVCIVF